MTKIVENTFGTENVYSECDDCQSVLSPAAYFVKLMETVEKYIKPNTLNSRRPDLENIKLDCDNTNKEKLYLEVANQIMEEKLKKESKGNILQKLATAKYPFNLPANFPLIGIRAYLKEHEISLAEMYKILIKDADTTAESLHLSPEAYQIIISTEKTESHLKEVYGVDNLEGLAKVDLFIAKANISYDELELLLDSYNKIKKLADSAKLTIKDKTINNIDNNALGFLHRFIRLAVQLDWSFTELGQILLIIDKNEINADTIKLIAAVKNLQNKLKQPLNKISELCYSSVDFFVTNKVPEEFRELLKKDYQQFQDIIDANVKISSTLQDILKVDGNELSYLVNYNDTKDKSKSSGNLRFLRIYKQVSLAKVVGIPILELIKFLSQLQITELNFTNIEHVIELNDWLKKYSITIAQLNDLLNPPISFQEQVSKIEEEIERQSQSSELSREELLYNIISQYVEVQTDLFNAIYEFTKKYKGSKVPVKPLLQNIAIFKALKLSAEDVNNITKHGDFYGIVSNWSLEQIKTIVSYKVLTDQFSNNDITFSKYTDWLRGTDYKESEVIEKIESLTNWNRNTLKKIKEIEIFKENFTKEKNSIESLTKIKLVMDVVTESGINDVALLELRDLYNLKVKDESDWRKYNDTLGNLELSGNDEVKERVKKYLAEQKRDILARYLVHILKIKDMRELYSHLLIDVEMSDCSKISPLKAALNSVQLYIHRSIMGLEKDVTIDKELNEEKWKWLSSYREWEAISKINLYPENYLNPTLQKIISPEYKTLQNTLMQGNITDEAVSNGYLKYFEDFEGVSTLKIVDSYFEEVEDKIFGAKKDTLYIIGRTIAQPYNYYYRTAVFDKDNEKFVYWTAWEKIESAIPAETVTPIYAFNRLFIFWLQQVTKKESEKGKQDDLSDKIYATINYIFQKPSGSWSAPHELASSIKIDIDKAEEKNKLHWKKVAAFYLREKEREEGRIIILMGEMREGKTFNLFTLDEDLTVENRNGKFADFSLEGERYSCAIDKDKKDQLFLRLTKNIFKSNATNQIDSDNENNFIPGETKLLGDFKISLAQQVMNKPGWFIIEGNLKGENVHESFLLFTNKAYDLSRISEKSTYEIIDQKKLECKYNSPAPKMPIEDVSFTFVRLNITGNVRELRKKAYLGNPKRVLTLDSQKFEQLKFNRFEPTAKVSHPPGNTLDFNGAYGIYLWEIFYHIPTLIAWHLNQEQDFSIAQKWYQYILDPNNTEQPWQFLPFIQGKNIIDYLKDSQTKTELEIDPYDPYIIAKQNIESFKKYIIISYVDNLIDWGNMLFAKGSWEGLNQATMIYIRAWDLLGPKPIKNGKHETIAKSFKELKGLSIAQMEAKLPASAQNIQIPYKRRSINEIINITKYDDYFCTPPNKEFIDLWNRIEDELYKIRHCLDRTGKSSVLPLFDSPIDPNQRVAETSSGNNIKIPDQSIPHYRFSYMISYAKSIVETVIQFGNELLSALEKKDTETLAVLYNKQEGIMANLITSIKEKIIEALKKEKDGLNESLLNAKNRQSHYERLIINDLSAGEKEAIALSSTAIDVRTGVAVTRGVAAVAHLIPTVYGLAVGAFQPGNAIEVGANIAESAAMILNEKAQIAYTTENYRRRAEDWELQKAMASYDTEQINYQIEANKIYQDNAIQDLKAHKKSIEQIKEKEEFFRSKFTNRELYNWMRGQIARVYFQAYKMALEVAVQAEKAYQYELNNNKSYITANSWNSMKEGLLAGNNLKFQLEEMIKNYNNDNKRALEITKVISLKQMDPLALHELKNKGSCKFSFTEKLFDLDFPGHYCRKIKNIRITVPAVVGPYENIHASLQQTSNKVVLKDDIDAIKFLLGEKGINQPDSNVLRTDFKPNQQIAISKGDQDSGLFELNFNDERYLPFEGTGAVSDWELNLPQGTNRFNVSTISDVIIHVDYTAFDGGKGFRQDVQNLSTLKCISEMLLLNLSVAYPDAWEKFKQKYDELTFKPSAEIFPTYVKNPEIGDSIYVFPTPQAPNMKITVNSCNWDPKSYKINIDKSSIKLDSDWKLKAAGTSSIDEITIIIPYTGEINWS
ncbi:MULTISPECIES: neuraminidase-like domain-containing protein [Wolbachia]|uniref:Tc toxin subunit A-related protein n=1 Tax=Wolbachia TaxID=953 RepID=UPI002220AB36|nr:MULTISPECIES: neuraminidase-like domain-containing protein [Wolbachia]BDG77058.1 hypothetical protein wHmc_01900 [Wolbachia pipientis]